MRRMIEFACAGETLVATLDDASGTNGLLIVSGGNEIRVGAHRGMAELAARMAAAGHPVFRYDRRGIGDSSGENNGFLSSFEDIQQAANAFRRACPHLQQIVAFGNCDAASALILFHAGAQIDALVLANPWTIGEADDLPPAAAIRARYLEKLFNPREWGRLLSGRVNIHKLVSGLTKISAKPSAEGAALAARLATALGNARTPVTILIARGDNTGIAFAEHWRQPSFDAARAHARVIELQTSSHSFAGRTDKQWLADQLLAALHYD